MLALQSDTTADTLKEVLEDVNMDFWGLDMAKMSGDNATNNRKAFPTTSGFPVLATICIWQSKRP